MAARLDALENLIGSGDSAAIQDLLNQLAAQRVALDTALAQAASAEQLAQTAVPVFVAKSPELDIETVKLSYRSLGMTRPKTVELAETDEVLLVDADTEAPSISQLLGVLDETGTKLSEFITVGVDDETHRAIGDLPEGHGILGLLIVDATQGIQAQTISNLYLALEHDLEIIPILNKMDLDSAMAEEVSDQIVELIGCDPSEIIPASGKTGQGVEEILKAVIERVPAPAGDPDAPLQAMIFDSVFNSFRGIIAYFRIRNGKLIPTRQASRVCPPARGRPGPAPSAIMCSRRRSLPPMTRKTILNPSHRALGARMVDFGGWDMPINYGSQIEEHHAVRRDAGMFDVSHMTVVDLHGADVRAFLRRLLANSIDKLKVRGKALYTCMLDANGGVIDDLIIYNLGDGFQRLVVNAATREKDLAWINEQANGFAVSVAEQEGLAMIAIQGPQARDKVGALLGPLGHPVQATDVRSLE